jgi:hypothetical protein
MINANAVAATLIGILPALNSACAGATTLGQTPLSEIYGTLDYVGIVEVVRVREAKSIVVLEVKQIEHIKGDRAHGTFMISAPESDLVPRTERLLLLSRPGSDREGPRGRQWVFPLVSERDEAFVLANRDNIFFASSWLSTSEMIPLFVVEGGRIHAAMNLTLVRRALRCASSPTPKKGMQGCIQP